ncbi:hypothetical protein Tco_1114232 [Tanacetum coccineum]|uniref:Uncharacterized protein n=1 Tax=Tanacetum coccineum TaxID=301880 RepID=A0ABQ5IUK6_9ASTR
MVAATEPTTIQSAILKARMLTDEAIRKGAMKKITAKKRINKEPSRDGNARDNNKRSRTGKAFSIITNPVRKEYIGGALGRESPECSKPDCNSWVMAIEGGQSSGNNGNQARERAFVMGVDEACQDLNIVTGMDWLSRHKAEIVCHEKVVRIPLPNGEILRVLRERPEEKGHFSPLWKLFIHNILHCLSPKKTAWEEFSSNIATAIICLATNCTFNFSNLIFEAMVKNLDSRSKFLMYPRFIQIFLNKRKRMLLPYKRTFPTPTLTQLFSNIKRASKGYSRVDIPLFPTMLTTPESSPSRITSSPSLSPQTHPSTSQPLSTPPSNQTTHVTEEAALMPHESPLQSVQSLSHDEGSLSLNELICTSLSKKVESLESELKQTKQTYNAALTKLIKRVKKLEQTIKTSQARRRAKVVIFDDKEAEEDPSNQGRSLIEELDLDAGISLVPPHAADQGRFDDTQISDQPKEQLGVFSAATTLVDAARRRRSVENVQTYIRRRREVSTGSGGVSTASRLVSTADISTVSKLDSTAGVKAKDKGKTIMHEFKTSKKIKKRVQVQMSVDEELAKKVFEEEQAKFNAKQEARFKAEQEQERINFETALELQKQLDEREEVAAKFDEAHDIDSSDPAVLRYHTLQNKPFSVAEVRKNMCLYLKNQGGYKMSHFKGLIYEDIRPIFEREWDQNHAFIPIGSEVEKEVMKRSRFDLQQESSKPVEEEIVQQDDVIAEQVVKENSKTAGGRRKKSLARKRARETLSEESAKKQKLEDDIEKEELQVFLNIVPEEESLDVESLATKQDVLELYRLVKERFQTTSPEGYDLLLWGDKKTLIDQMKKMKYGEINKTGI